MQSMSIYVIPAIIALAFKIFILFVSRRGGRMSNHFVFMVLVFAFHNLCEVLCFWEYFHNIKGEYLLRTYYVISLLGLLAIGLHCSRVSGQGGKLFEIAMLITSAIVSLLILFTDMIVSGTTSWGYIFTAMRGEFYWIFQVVSLNSIVCISGLLVLGYRKSENHDSQIQCVYMGLALLPLICAMVLVISLMNFGFKINAAAILPIATTLVLFCILASERRHKLTDVRRFIPYSDERKTSNEIMEIFSSYARDESNYRDAVSDIERLLVQHKYKKNDCNASSAAELMGMPRSSLYSLFNRLNIKRD